MHLSVSRALLRLVVLLILGHLWYLLWVSDFRMLAWFRRIDLLMLDTEVRFSESPGVPTRPRPVVLGLTRRDIKEFGPFPWPRARWAEVIGQLDRSGAEKIVLDVFFLSKGTDRVDDEKLVREVGRTAKVLLPVYSSILIETSSLEGGGVTVGQIQLNESRLQSAAAGSGHINAFLDIDEKIRFVPLFLRHGKNTYYQISLESLKNTESARAFLSEIQIDEEWPGLLIDYRGFDNRYEFYSIGELMRGEIDPARLRGRTIFVGQTTQGLPFADIVSTPIGLRHGIFILAGLFDQIRSGILIRPLSPLNRHIFFYGVCVGSVLLAGFLNQRLRILAFFCIPAAFFLIHLALFQNHSLLLPFTTAILAATAPMILAFVGSDFYFRISAKRALQQSEKLSNIGRMAGMIAHDIRNPLAIIQGRAAALLEKPTQADGSEGLRSINRQARRIAVMLEELLDYSTGQIRVERRETDFFKFLQAACAEIERDFCSEKGVVLELTASQKSGSVAIDELRFQRALENLAKNAVQAMPKGGRIGLDLSTEGAQWILRVRDTGPGLPLRVRTRLFEPFVTAGSAHGIGLGLPIVREIVQIHGGTIELESSGSEGTCFVIRLPQK